MSDLTDRLSALKQAQASSDVFERLGFFGLDQPRCPHCGESCNVSDNDWWRLYEEGEHEVTCPHCDEDFSVTTRVSYTFTTDSQEDGHE